MKTLVLTDEQFALLQALTDSEAMGFDSVQDTLGEAAAAILHHDHAAWENEAQEDAALEAEVALQNSLWEALAKPQQGTIAEAVLAAMDDWKSGGERNIDTMREQIGWLVEEAVGEWQENNVDATTNEELGIGE